MTRERTLRIRSRQQCAARIRERVEERVPLRVDLHPAARTKGVAQEPAMVREHIHVAVAERVQQARRALDIREQQRHGAGRKIAADAHRATLDARTGVENARSAD